MVSVIISTYNEGSLIVNCLNSLAKQSLENFEIIVVDDGSTDNTLTLLESLMKTNPKFGSGKIRLVVKKSLHAGPGSARNIGSKSANGEILVFVDADMVFERNFLKNLTKPIGKNGVIGTFSKLEYVLNWENRLSRCWNINEGWEPRRRHPKNYPDHQKVFRAILKKEFDRVGGFSVGGYTDDYSLYSKLGVMAVNAPKSIYYHANPETFKEIFIHAKWTSKREYRFGFLGEMIALVRATLPFSIVFGVTKSIISREPYFIFFKIVYDIGVFLGILQKMIWKKQAK